MSLSGVTGPLGRENKAGLETAFFFSIDPQSPSRMKGFGEDQNGGFVGNGLYADRTIGPVFHPFNRLEIRRAIGLDHRTPGLGRPLWLERQS